MLSSQEERWEEYNMDCESTSVLVAKSKDSKAISATSYSHAYFEDFELKTHLNTSSKRMIQLGASTGKFLKEYQDAEWTVVGYDYSASSIRQLKNNNIPYEPDDLNARNKSGELTYGAKLAEYVAKGATNILLIRILEYLEPSALTLLIYNLMDNAAPGSVFFIAGAINENPSKPMSPTTPNYRASFFGARTDMEIIVLKKVYTTDELLVVRKR